MTKMKEYRKKSLSLFSSLRALDSLSTYLRINSLKWMLVFAVWV